MAKYCAVLGLLFIVCSVSVACNKSDKPDPGAPVSAPSTVPSAGASSAPVPETSATNAATPSANISDKRAILVPPKGHKVAIVVFEDLQCPSCAAAEPQLKEAEKAYNIPLVRHDFPIPQHSWSLDAHVVARYFDSRSKVLGEEFRHFIFMNQTSITKENFRGTAEKFGEEHKAPLPFVVDPTGQFAAQIREDFNLGRSAGVTETPTIYIVSDSHSPVQVTDRRELFQKIDQVIKQ